MEFWLYDHSVHNRQILNVDLEKILVGRDPTCDIVLKGPFVAKRHAQIVCKGNQLLVENLSQAGTRVANREVKNGPVHFDLGDEIQIGQFSLAAIRPDRDGRDGRPDRRERQGHLVQFEQQVHADLLERMNLRVTGHIDKTDAAYVGQILEHLEQIINQQTRDLNPAMIEHMIHTHLHRLMVAEVVRQGQGRLQTEYTSMDNRLLDPKLEAEINALVSAMVDSMPLLFDLTSVVDDLAAAELAFDDLFGRELPSIGLGLRRYIVHRTISKDIHDIMFGLGPLQDLLDMANVSEIMVVGKDTIYVEKNGVIQPTTRSFFSDDVLMSIIERILAPVGRRVDTSSPLVDARLPDGSRANVIIPPLSLVGPTLTIRKFAWIPFTIDDLIERDTISASCASFIQGCVLGRRNLIISGGTGSGKTTLLNTLAAYAKPAERIVTIEESAELKLPQPHVVSLESRPANVEGRGAYTIRDLVRNALRMRPDRIIIGEVRGPEALDMLQAMNTGHDGSLSTIHANSPHDAMKRLETLVLMAVDMPMRAIREQIVAALDVVVQIARFANGARRITAISQITGIDRDTSEIRLEDIFVLRDPAQPTLRHTGYVPTFAEALIKQGLIGVKVFL